MQKQLILKFWFAHDEYLCECLADEKACLEEVFYFLKEALLQKECLLIHAEETAIFEENDTGTMTDSRCPLEKLHLRNGTLFNVYY